MSNVVDNFHGLETIPRHEMSRRGIHPLLMGLDRPARNIQSKQPAQWSGSESAQRKRYLRLEADEFLPQKNLISQH